MDFFSHGLWTFIIARFLKRKTGKNFNLGFAVFWSVFPDLFAFAIPFVYLFWNFAAGRIPFYDLPRPDKIEPAFHGVLPASDLVAILYPLGHSLVIFALAMAIIGGLILINRALGLSRRFKAFPWVLGGWFIHILMDIPTHSSGFFSTPLFWPISDWKLDGLYWGTPWFLVLNYILIAAVYRRVYGFEKIKIFINWPRWKNILAKLKLDLD